MGHESGRGGSKQLHWHQAVIISAVKFVFWHFGQIVFFWTAWFAYKDMMSWGQFCFATIVALKEALYFVNLMHVTYFSPGYLLLAPFSEKNKPLKLAYFLSQESVVMSTLVANVVGRVATLNRVSNVECVLAWFAGISYLASIAASLSAWIALVIGFFGHGAMFSLIGSGLLAVGSFAHRCCCIVAGIPPPPFAVSESV